MKIKNIMVDLFENIGHFGTHLVQFVKTGNPMLKNQNEKNSSSKNKMEEKKVNQSDFSAYTILQKKSQGKQLTAQEIKWFINGLLSGEIPDYQMTALLMAIHINGFDAEETSALTDAMLYSGTVLNFPEQRVIDKHSTGGVGDKTSFILAPIAAACGVKVPMISGRGLGHTGGTTDKIESIPGFKTSLSIDEFKENPRFK